jgi:hypothetical protein
MRAVLQNVDEGPVNIFDKKNLSTFESPWAYLSTFWRRICLVKLDMSLSSSENDAAFFLYKLKVK